VDVLGRSKPARAVGGGRRAAERCLGWTFVIGAVLVPVALVWELYAVAAAGYGAAVVCAALWVRSKTDH
jgi:hypothetical protein